MSGGLLRGPGRTPVVEVRGLVKRYRDTTALDGVDVTIEEGAITGLLGRNGAGKTTLMQILTGQLASTSGTVRVLGEDPVENDGVLAQTCFIKESLRYPDDFTVHHVLAAAAFAAPDWDAEFASTLIADFSLPLRRPMKKLSRGMLSAVGVTVGLASRAPLTFFDEPYLGLDAVARQVFYDRLLADYAEHPRTVILSTHLVDEVASLLSRVVVLDAGRVVLDAAAEDLRGQAVALIGHRTGVATLAAGREQLATEGRGDLVRTSVRGTFDSADRRAAADLGVRFEPISLQQLVVLTTRPPVTTVATTETDTPITSERQEARR